MTSINSIASTFHKAGSHTTKMTYFSLQFRYIYCIPFPSIVVVYLSRVCGSYICFGHAVLHRVYLCRLSNAACNPFVAPQTVSYPTCKIG